MIDIEKEIEKYSYIDLEDEYEDDYGAFKTVLEKIHKDIERIGKLQYKSSGSIEEAVELLDEILEAGKEKSIIYDEVIKALNESTDKAEELVKGIIAVTDIFDEVYHFSISENNNTWTEQLALQRDKIDRLLVSFGIQSIGKTGEGFDFRLHSAVEVRRAEGFEENQIAEVVKCGYMYNGRVIRKAEAVINKTEAVR